MLGMDPKGPAQTIDTWFSRIHPDDAVKIERIIVDVITNPAGTRFEAEVRARHADGQWIWILERGAVVERAADGSPVRIAGTYLDISDRRVARNGIARKRSDLPTAVRQPSAADMGLRPRDAGLPRGQRCGDCAIWLEPQRVPRHDDRRHPPAGRVEAREGAAR